VKVLITGAAGQVGRILSSNAPSGMSVVGYGHKDLDITDADAVDSRVRAQSPDLIINAAAYTAVDRAETEVELAHNINAKGPRYLASAAQAVGARLIQISTDFVFDGLGCAPYKTDAVTHPLSVYGKSKLAGEHAVLEILPERSVVLRTAWVYAAEGSNFVRTMLRIMKANGSVRVVTDQVGTPTSARSLVEALWWIAANPELRGIHHWTDAGVASWYDFAVAIAEEGARLDLLSDAVTVTPIATHEYPTPARRPSYSVLDKQTLTALGLVPVHWRKRLRSVLEEIGNA
jgi:dTDP-4-dehydrorhamnose reductase